MKRQKLLVFAWILTTTLVTPFYSQDFKKLQVEASQAYDKAEFAKSLELAQKAIKAAKNDKKATVDDIYELDADLGVYLVYNEKVEDGLVTIENVISKMKEVPASGKTEIYVRKNYGYVLKELGYYADASPQFEKIYNLTKSVKIEKIDQAAIISAYAECQQYLYKFNEAELLFKEAITLCEKENLTKEIEYAAAYTALGLLYTDMLYEKKAIEAYDKAEKIYQSNQDTAHAQYAIFLMNYGGLLTEIYQYEKALSFLMQSKRLHLQIYGENSPEYAGILNNIAYTYEKMGKLMETEQFYTRALEIKKMSGRTRYDNYLTGINNLLFFYGSIGRNQKVDELLPELEKGMESTKLQDTLKRLIFSENLASIYAERKMYIKAQNYYNQSVKYTQRIYGDDNAELGNILISLSAILWEQKKYDEATETIKKATTVLEKSSRNNLSGSFTLIRNMAVMLQKFHLPKQAEPFIDQALKLIESKTITHKNDVTDIYLQKANISADLDKIETAIDYFKKFLDMKLGQIDDNFSYMTEAEKLEFIESLEQAVKDFITTISNHIQKRPELIQILLDFRLQTKAMLLNNLSKIKKAIVQMNDKTLTDKFEKMKLNRENISKLMSLNTDEYSAALSEVDALKKEADLLEKEISAKVSGLSIKNTEKTSWKDLQAQLQPNECAIEIIRTNLTYANDSLGTNYMYIILKNKGNPEYVMIDRPLKWENEVLGIYRKSIDDKKDEPDLYRRLWKSVDEKLTGINTVFISTDGIYNQVNLNTILNHDTKKYLIEEKNIHYLTSLKDVLYLKNNPSQKPLSAILIGNPSFSYDLAKLPENKKNFGDAIAVRGSFGFVLDPLPGTKTEVETIKSQLEKKSITGTLLTEEKANEAEVKKIKNPDVLHFATHGFFLEDFSEESLSELTKTEQAYYRNPMMRSGIFFSGANNTYSLNTTNINKINEFEDGMLTAYEAMNLELDKTQLVVLSACQTGLGKVKNGEGVFGLQRAFKLAGAKSVIMSLWPVSDDATMELMVSFYDKWTATGDIYKSFKEAQLEVKKKYPEPYFWGAFVLSGR